MVPLTANAKYHGQDRASLLGQWYGSILRPDIPPELKRGCCGEGDAYEADDYKDMGDHYEVRITDGSEKLFPDGSRRIPLEEGQVVIVPKEKVNPPKDGNPTGHAQLFVSVVIGSGDQYGRIIAVWCFVPLPPST